MQLHFSMFLIVCPLVFIGGLVDSIAGGGGIITLPAYLLAGVPIHIAIGSNKFSSFSGTCISTFRYWKKNFMVKKIILPTVIAALAGSFAGAHLSLSVSEDFLKYLLLVLLPFLTLLLFRRKKRTDMADETVFDEEKLPHSLYLKAVLCSFLIGGYDGFYGPGTGTFLMLALTGWLHLPAGKAAGNTKVINLTSNLAALVTFLVNGTILIPLAAAAAVFSIAGHYTGSSLVIKNGSRVIRPLLILVLILLFIKILSGN